MLRTRDDVGQALRARHGDVEAICARAGTRARGTSSPPDVAIEEHDRCLLPLELVRRADPSATRERFDAAAHLLVVASWVSDPDEFREIADDLRAELLDEGWGPPPKT
jgi:hypothetical protein